MALWIHQFLLFSLYHHKGPVVLIISPGSLFGHLIPASFRRTTHADSVSMTLSECYRMDGLDDSMSEDVGCGSVMMSL